MPHRHPRSVAACQALLAGAWLAAAAPLGARPADAPVVEVALSNFAFTPATIRLDHGRAYVLHLVNRSDGGHDFSARAFFDAARIAPEDRATIDDGSVELAGGAEASIHLTAPAAPGRYKVHCGHFMHGLFGMTGTILVQ